MLGKNREGALGQRDGGGVGECRALLPRPAAEAAWHSGPVGAWTLPLSQERQKAAVPGTTRQASVINDTFIEHPSLPGTLPPSGVDSPSNPQGNPCMRPVLIQPAL